VRSGTKRAVGLATLLCAAALAYAQTPPSPVCLHQWIPNGQPTFGPPPVNCSSTKPYTNFTDLHAERLELHLRAGIRNRHRDRYEGSRVPFDGHFRRRTISVFSGRKF